MPYFAGPVADERDALLTFLGVPRAALRAAVFGLTDEQARSRPAASALCLGGLVNHAARTERRWVVAGIAGQPLPGQPLAVNPEQSVRWVLFHLIQETARHAGHADIIRETLDGRRAGQLLDAYEAG
jgi:Protein of unknown function (DUF664)